MERENSRLEYKERPTDSYLKTVSAFANGKGGTIVFGVTDRSEVVGLSSPWSVALQVENKINDSIDPRPDFAIEIDQEQKLVRVQVYEGGFKPYYYGNKAYVRNDTSTVEMSSQQLEAMILQKKRISFDALPSDMQELTFARLGNELHEKLGIEHFGKDSMKSLGLFSMPYGFTIAAQLVSEQNEFPGIDLVKYGADINEIRFRQTIEHCSILEIYKKAEELFDLNYRYERIEGRDRQIYRSIPLNAFREAVLNALIHRDWSRKNARILMKMFDDRIEISSPGGLPEGIDEEEYMNDDLSVPRNPLLAYLFLRLGYIERLGTGIRRIRFAYKEAHVMPSFRFSQNAITVILPVLQERKPLSKEETAIFSLIDSKKSLSRKELEGYSGFGRSKLSRILHGLIEKNYIQQDGKGRSTRYAAKKFLS